VEGVREPKVEISVERRNAEIQNGNFSPQPYSRRSPLSRFVKLLEATEIGAVELRNRIVMPAMVTNYANADGSVSDRLVNYYAERAKGGVGLQIVEATAVNPVGLRNAARLCVSHDKYVPGLATLTRTIHEYGGKCALQLSYAGRQGHKVLTGKQTVAPSIVRDETTGESPAELTIEEIERIEDAFAEAAARAKKAGFDAVELHGAHGVFINQFLSPHSNKRTDKYGKNLEGRMRFALEIVERARERVGRGFIINFRLGALESFGDGLTIEDSKRIAKRLEEAGIDAINVSKGGGLSASLVSTSPMYAPHVNLVPLAEEIKKVVNVPVIVSGGITPEMGEDILQAGKVDLIAMGRALIADPDLPRKLVDGSLEDVRRCIRCNDGCIDRIRRGAPVECSVNAVVGREAEHRLTSAPKPKKVLVIGGGPAGLEAARVAALRGHQVTVYEKGNRLGGHLIEGSRPEFKADIRPLIDWLSTQARKAGVTVELQQEVTLETVQEMRPDVVITSTGSAPMIPKIPQIENPIVVTAIDALLGKVKIGKEVVVAGGGSVGCETALFLAEDGRKTTVVEMLPDILIDMESESQTVLREQLAQKGVKWLTDMKIVEIMNEGVIAVDKRGQKHVIKADNVVLAMGQKPSRELHETLKGQVPELHAIGDCTTPGRIIQAIQQGFRIAYQI